MSRVMLLRGATPPEYRRLSGPCHTRPVDLDLSRRTRHKGEEVVEGKLGRIIARAVRDIRDDEEVINLVTTLIWMHQQDRHGWEIIEHESA